MIPYILRAGIILAGCLIFYKVLLQKETFFRLNRWVLLACLLISFSLPLIQVPAEWSFRNVEPVVSYTDQPASYDKTLPSAELATVKAIPAPAPVKQSTISFSQVMTWVGWLYWFGVSVFAISFMVQIITLLYRAYTNPVIRDGNLRIVELAGDIAPCSFGNNIFINPQKYDWETYTQVLLHEKVHIRQGHSLDILLAEIVLIFQWFNPFAWLYRKTLESNLEYLTDDQLLQYPEVEKSSYQLSLVKVSAPHFPLSLTTNYNQSLLKKRVAMMNAKKSNIQTSWKYFFLLPLLLLFISLFNEPKAVAQTVTKKNDGKVNKAMKSHGMPTEGYWFATIKDDNIMMQFKSEEDDMSTNSTSFQLHEIKDLPKETSGTFTLTRDAGTMQFTGKFEGKQGMGRYKFVPNDSYADAMLKDGVDITDDKDQMVFFMVDVSKGYVQMLKSNGYTGLKKDDLIPLAALEVDAAFIQSLKKAGYTDISIHDLIPVKALGINDDYIKEIQKAGFTDVSVQQLISFKAQGIDGKYIADVRKSAGTERKMAGNKTDDRSKSKVEKNEDISAEDIISMKALDINPEYIRSLEEVGYKNISNETLVPMKAQGITADYIRNLQAAGYKDISPDDLIAIKAQDITPEYVKSFESAGIKNISLNDAFPLKALNVTPEYIKSFRSIGYTDMSVDKAVSLKSQNITAALVKEYKAMGFDDISLDDVISAKATGTTPSFINSMKEKGHKLRSIEKYIQLKTALE